MNLLSRLISSLVNWCDGQVSANHADCRGRHEGRVIDRAIDVLDRERRAAAPRDFDDFGGGDVAVLVNRRWGQDCPARLDGFPSYGEGNRNRPHGPACRDCDVSREGYLILGQSLATTATLAPLAVHPSQLEGTVAVIVIDAALTARNRVVEKDWSVERNGLRWRNELASHGQLPHARTAVVALAGENRGATIDGSGRDGAGAEAVIELVHLIRESLRDERVLGLLGCREVCGVELLLKVKDAVVLVLDLPLVTIEFELAELVDDCLRTSLIGCDYVPDAIREGRAVGAVLGEDGRGLLGVSQLVVAANSVVA